MRFFIRILTTSAILIGSLCASSSSLAQTRGKNSGYMEYIIEGGDTIYVDALRAAKIYQKLPRQKGRDWRKYYRLVYNFNKVYPYAIEARRIMAQVDSTVTTDELKRGKKEKYIKAVQSNLFNAYEGTLKNMTVSQGALLMKLIDRESGLTTYEIIKDYRNGMAAGFWQGIAKLFGTDTKKHYDPQGEDAATEDLVVKWQDGDFDNFYFSLFWEYPSKTELKPDLASRSKKGDK